MYFGSLPEEFLLVILDSDSGEFIIKNDLFIEIGLSGACLLELVLQGRIALKSHEIWIVDETPVDDPTLQKIFNLIIQEEGNHTALFWVRRIMNKTPNLKELFIDKLMERDLLFESKEKKFWIFSTTKYYEKKPEYDEVIKQYVGNVVTVEKEADPRTLAFLSLLYATNSTGTIFDDDELEDCIERIRALVADEEIGKSVSETINTIIDALMRNFIVSSPYPY
jgi:hypothetical protein